MDEKKYLLFSFVGEWPPLCRGWIFTVTFSLTHQNNVFKRKDPKSSLSVFLIYPKKEQGETQLVTKFCWSSLQTVTREVYYLSFLQGRTHKKRFIKTLSWKLHKKIWTILFYDVCCCFYYMQDMRKLSKFSFLWVIVVF